MTTAMPTGTEIAAALSALRRDPALKTDGDRLLQRGIAVFQSGPVDGQTVPSMLALIEAVAGKAAALEFIDQTVMQLPAPARIGLYARAVTLHIEQGTLDAVPPILAVMQQAHGDNPVTTQSHAAYLATQDRAAEGVALYDEAIAAKYNLNLLRERNKYALRHKLDVPPLAPKEDATVIQTVEAPPAPVNPRVHKRQLRVQSAIADTSEIDQSGSTEDRILAWNLFNQAVSGQNESFLTAARHLRANGQHARGIRLCDQFIRANPSQICGVLEMIAFHRAMGQDAQAERWLDIALERAPTNPNLLSDKVVCLMDRHAHDAARALVARARRLEPENLGLIRVAARFEFHAGRFFEASKLLTPLVQRKREAIPVILFIACTEADDARQVVMRRFLGEHAFARVSRVAAKWRQRYADHRYEPDTKDMPPLGGQTIWEVPYPLTGVDASATLQMADLPGRYAANLSARLADTAVFRAQRVKMPRNRA